MDRAHPLGALLLAALLVVPLEAQPTTARGEGSLPQDRPSDTAALTLAEARSLALARNPHYLAALQRLEAARGDLTAARTYPFNPQAEIEGPGSLSAGGPQRWEARLAQEVEWAGQGGLREDAADAGVRATAGEALDEARLLLAEVEGSYVALAAAEERLTLAREIEGLNARLVEAVRIELAEGEISVLEANLAEIEAARARARVLEVGREVAGLELALGRLLGFPPETAERIDASSAVELPTRVEEASLAVATALATRPDLRAARTAVERAESLRRLAGREALPNLHVAGIAEREAPGAEPRFGISVGVPIPLFDRNQGLRVRREAEIERSALEAQAVELRVRTEVQDALRSFRTSEEELEIFREDVLAPVRENQDLLEIAYREGKLDLSALLLLRNQLLDAELDYWEAWERNRAAAVALRSATAAVLDDAMNEFPEDLR